MKPLGLVGMLAALLALTLVTACGPGPLAPGPGMPPWLDPGPGAWWLLAIPAAVIAWFAVPRARRKDGAASRRAPDGLEMEQRLDRLGRRLSLLEGRMQDLEQQLAARAQGRPGPASKKEKPHEEL